MARKAVLEGGRKDEIIRTAGNLFLEHGYEATSVRMIMNEVGGEIGMFYHYFKSKDSLFDAVVERFFNDYRKKFEAVLLTCRTPQELVKTLMPIYEQSMEDFDKLKGRIHWSMQASMHEGTLQAMKPAIQSLIETWNVNNPEDPEILAGQVLYGLSGTVHSKAFIELDPVDREKCVLEFIRRCLD